MSQLPVQEFSTRAISVSGAGSLVTEASDLGLRGFQPLYDDACDVGIALRSHRTGAVTRWHLAEEHVRDGDITHWTLRPTTESVRQQPQIQHYKLTIYND